MIDNNEKDTRKEPPRAYNMIKIVRFCFLLLIVVLLMWTVYHFREELNIDNFMRFLSYLDSGEVTESEAAFKFNANPKNRFVAFKSGFVVLSPDGLSYLNPVGKEELSVKTSFANPGFRINDKRLLAFDIGGKNLVMTSDYSVVFNRTTEAAIINARMNEKNWFTLITNDEGYKSGLTVCDDGGREVFRWQSSKNYLIDADVAPGCKDLAACAFKYSEGEIVSSLVGFSLDSEEPLWQVDLGPSLAVSVKWLADDKIIVLTDTALIFLNAKGEITSRLDFDGMTLKNFAENGNGFLTLLFTRNRVGSINLLMTVDDFGSIIAQKETDEAISQLKAENETIATLSSDGVTVYTKEFNQQKNYPDASSCHDIALGQGGRIFGILSNSAYKIQE